MANKKITLVLDVPDDADLDWLPAELTLDGLHTALVVVTFRDAVGLLHDGGPWAPVQRGELTGVRGEAEGSGGD